MGTGERGLGPTRGRPDRAGVDARVGGTREEREDSAGQRARAVHRFPALRAASMAGGALTCCCATCRARSVLRLPSGVQSDEPGVVVPDGDGVELATRARVGGRV